MILTRAATPAELDDFCRFTGSAPLTPNAPSIRQADAHYMVRSQAAAILARCSLWWSSAPAYPEHRLGLIGHYAAQDDAAAALLLDHVCRQLAERGCTLAAGPMDGSTHRHYRFVTERAVDGIARPPFFLEPDNPDAWPVQFARAGFTPLAHYFSAIGDLPAPDPRLPALVERCAAAGITVRPVDLDAFDLELQSIYTVVAAAFQTNFLYTPIDRAEFLAQYAPVRPHIRPATTLIAEQSGAAVGFAFSLPDLAQAQRGQQIDTLIIKTVAVRPEVSGLGLGSLLTARVHEAAAALGFRHAVHALMHETNRSRHISAHTAKTMRRYTLYSRPLAAG